MSILVLKAMGTWGFPGSPILRGEGLLFKKPLRIFEDILQEFLSD
jgi:hypothetical protein